MLFTLRAALALAHFTREFAWPVWLRWRRHGERVAGHHHERAAIHHHGKRAVGRRGKREASHEAEHAVSHGDVDRIQREITVAERRWIVPAHTGSDGETLSAVLEKIAPQDPAALSDGRVFVGAIRVAEGNLRIAAGHVVSVFDRRQTEVGDVVEILAERDGVIAACKPASLATIADHHGREGTLIAEVAKLRGVDASTLHATSRLDVGVSGVVLITTTVNARERLVLARETSAYARTYLAIASGKLETEKVMWNEPIGRAQDARLRKVGGKDPVAANTSVTRLATARGATLLKLEPGTGRTHQLRVHAAFHGFALLGDAAYRGPARITSPDGSVRRLDRIALHAWCVTTPDARGNPWRVTAKVPSVLRDVWRLVDGGDAVWDEFAS